MNTRVFRLDLAAEPALDAAIVSACEKQRVDGFTLASTFVWGTDLILIFQKV